MNGMPNVIALFGQLLAEFVAERLFQDNVYANLVARQVKRKISKAIEDALKETIVDFPDGEYILNSLDIRSFLSDAVVQNELGKLLEVGNTAGPNTDLLKERWLQHVSGASAGNYGLIVDQMVTRLRKELWRIDEVRELLHMKDQTQTSELLRTSLPQIMSALSSLQPSVSSVSEPPGGTEGKILEKLEACNLLRKKGFPKAALHQLGEIQAETERQTVSNLVRSKLWGLAGACHLDLGDTEGAMADLSRAYALSPTDGAAIANYALVSLFKNQFDDAIRLTNEALAIKPEGASARAVKLEVLARKRNFVGVEDLVERKYLDDPQYVRAVGVILSGSPRSETAETYLRLALSQLPNDFYAGLAMCKVLTDKVAHARRHPATGMDNKQANALLTESSSIIEAIMKDLQEGDNRHRLHQAWAARAGIRAMMGDKAGAKTDSDAVLQAEPRQTIALQNRAIIALQEREYPLAVSLFSALPDDDLLDESICLPAIGAHLGAGEPDKALSLIDRARKRKSCDGYISLEASALIKKGDTEKARALGHEILRTRTDAGALEAAASIDQLLGDAEEAISKLHKAYDISSDEDHKCWLALELAHVNYDARRWAESANWFKKSGFDPLIDVELARLYAGALYRADNFQDALLVAKRVRENGTADKYLMELEAAILEFLGDLEGAFALSEQAQQTDSSDLHWRLNSARLLFRQDRATEAAALLDSIDPEGLTSIDQMATAEMYSLIGAVEKAIELAYRAFSQAKDSPEINRAYIGLFMRCEEHLQLDTSTVGPDTATLLVRQEEMRWMKILATRRPNEANWEYPVNSEQATLLLGHKVGDAIRYRTSPLETIVYEVKEIQSIYVRAFQEVLEEFGSRFPGDTSIQKIQISNDDITPFLSSVAKLGVASDQILELYKRRVLSLEAFARLSGRSQVETMRALQATSGMSIFVSQGSAEEQQEQAAFARNAVDITIALPALLTIHYLDMHSQLADRFSHIYIHQGILDEIDRLFVDLGQDRSRRRGTIGYHDGRFFMSDMSAAQIEEELNTLEAVRSLAKSKCQVVPIDARFANDLLNSRDLRRNPIGLTSAASVLVAQQTQTPLLVDDLAVSVYAKSQRAVKAFWTQPFLADLLEGQRISMSAYTNLCYLLLAAGYVYTTINADMVTLIAQEDKYSSTGRLAVLMSALMPPTNEADAIRIAAQVLKAIWMSIATPENRRFILDIVLKNVTARRVPERVLGLLSREVYRRLSLAPIQQGELLGAIEQWSNIHTPWTRKGL